MKDIVGNWGCTPWLIQPANSDCVLTYNSGWFDLCSTTCLVLHSCRNMITGGICIQHHKWYQYKRLGQVTGFYSQCAWLMAWSYVTSHVFLAIETPGYFQCIRMHKYLICEFTLCCFRNLHFWLLWSYYVFTSMFSLLLANMILILAVWYLSWWETCSVMSIGV